MTTPDERPEPQSKSSPTAASWRWPVALVVIVLALVVAYLLTLGGLFRVAEQVSGGLERVGQRLGLAAQTFRTETITETFVATLPQLAGDGSGRLELATATVTETVTRSDERRVLWDRVSLGETVAEIRVPVTYRYHVRLDDPWRLSISGQTCVVHAPALRPSLPPAIHTDGMEKRTQSGWLRFDAEEQLGLLEQSLTPRLEAYARSPEHLARVREECRVTVARFVRNWLLRENYWREDLFHAVVVRFADEPTPDDALVPTLSLGD